MVALSLIQEIAPVITALICAGKISSGIGAELGSMKVTEQIDAMEAEAKKQADLKKQADSKKKSDLKKANDNNKKAAAANQ
jgi:hypothetical protein